MSIKQFLQENRKEIDALIHRYYHVKITNDKDRLVYVLEDEGLYRWAHQEGVNI